MEPRAVYINSKQSFDLNKVIHCRLLKFAFFFMNMNFLDTSITIPAFNDMLSGWYGVQGNVEVVALEKVLRDMGAKNVSGKHFVFEFHEKLTSKAQMKNCLRAMVDNESIISEHFDLSGL